MVNELNRGGAEDEPMTIRVQPARNPDAAPHCPKCNYNLFGLTQLRCPECGHVIANVEELEEACLLATRNAVDRRAMFRQRAAGIAGAVLWIAGTTLGAVHVVRTQSLGSFANFRLLGTCVIGSLAYLYYEYRSGEPIESRLFLVGLLWFALALTLFCL
jgi:hypothetical protein